MPGCDGMRACLCTQVLRGSVSAVLRATDEVWHDFINGSIWDILVGPALPKTHRTGTNKLHSRESKRAASMPGDL